MAIDPIWQARWQTLDAIMELMDGRYDNSSVPRMDSLCALARRLRAFTKDHFEFFHRGFGNNKLKWSLDPKSKNEYSGYAPDNILNSILLQVGYDLEVIQRAAEQRLIGTRRIWETLQKGDELCWRALQPAMNWLPKGTTVLCYFQKSAHIRVLPYAPIALIGIPFTAMNSYRDFLAIPHEVGHYVYWHGSIEGQTIRDRVKGALKASPAYIKAWGEELFADVYGATIAGGLIGLDFQDLLDSTPTQDFLKDDADHPLPAVRPEIYATVLRKRQEAINLASYLDKHWEGKLAQRAIGRKTETKIGASKTIEEVSVALFTATEAIHKLLDPVLSDWLAGTKADASLQPMIVSKPSELDALYKLFDAYVADLKVSGEVPPLEAGELDSLWLNWIKSERFFEPADQVPAGDILPAGQNGWGSVLVAKGWSTQGPQNIPPPT